MSNIFYAFRLLFYRYIRYMFSTVGQQKYTYSPSLITPNPAILHMSFVRDGHVTCKQTLTNPHIMG
jgi:hypothetical protein